jgi:hypothetical protein
MMVDFASRQHRLALNTFSSCINILDTRLDILLCVGLIGFDRFVVLYNIK